ncbi:MAG: hypothetical protein ABFD92_11535 [Planctomycetaceae bacterium]|nr:hypothetical protein [Planctomycetaceae bacterium]
MKMKCPRCSTKLEVDAAAEKDKCPICGHEFSIPQKKPHPAPVATMDSQSKTERKPQIVAQPPAPARETPPVVDTPATRKPVKKLVFLVSGAAVLLVGLVVFGFLIPSSKTPTIASPLVPKGVDVSGAAYVVRRNGQSDILRGFHVTLIQASAPAQVLERALTTVVQNCKSESVDWHKEAAEGRRKYGEMESSTDDNDPDSYEKKCAKEADSKAEKYSQILAKVEGPVDSAAALTLIESTGYVNVIRDFVDNIKIAATTTDVQGTYKFTDAPTSAYIFAMFDTKDGFLMWAIPVQGSGSKDLFNDTALPSR